MFKASRWRSEKNKIKVVFKLQFHATQVSLLGVDALAVSVVPADAGKPTTRLEKATIKDGSCYWDNPVHETVKFIRDPKSGKIQERIYHFIVENGSSKGGVLGDASIDMSCYALATKSSSVSLPVKGSKSEVLLHVSIQRMSSSVDERGPDEIERLKQISQDRSLRAKMSMEDIDLDIDAKISPIEDVQFLKSSNPISKINGINNRRESNGSDITLSSTDSSLGIDNENNIHHEPKAFFSFKNNNVSMLRNPVSDESLATPVVVHNEGQKSWEWLGGLALESSTDDSSETGDNIVEKLKRDVSALSRQAEMSELELQALRKQIVKESRKGQDLSKEIIKLKEERESLKEEFEKFKANPGDLDEKTSDLQAIVVELRQELSYEKDLNKNLQIQLEKTQESNSALLLAVQDLDELLEQKNREREDLIERSAAKASIERLHDENSVVEMDNDEEQGLNVLEHKSKDLNVLEQKIRDLKSEMEKYRTQKEEIEVQMEQLALDYELSKQENHEILYKLEQCELQEKLKMQYECSSPYVALNELENQIETLENELNEKSERSNELELQVKKKSEQSNELELQVKSLKDELDKRSHEHSDSLIATKELEFRVSSLENELNEKSARFSDSLKTITELESQVKDLKDELEKRSHEHSDSLIATKELEFQVLSLEDELEKQAHGFESDLEALMRAKVEQEQRAIQAEETLKKMRWLNVSATERLQDEFRKLSAQMTSSFEANESLAAKALTDANELRMQKILLEEKLRKAFESSQIVREQYKSKLQELSGQVVTLTKQLQKLQSESNYKSERIEHDAKLAKETEKTHEQEISMLKTRIGALETENQSLLKQLQETESLITELDHTKSSFTELEARYEQCKKEKAELETRIALVKSRAEESLRELRRTTCLIDEKDAKAKEMQMEVENLENRCNLMKKVLSEDEFEKEKLRDQVFQLKNDLKKRDSNLQEKIKLLEDQIKQEEIALENSTSSFMEKENELHRKIEGLEQSLQSLSHSSAMLHEQNPNKATKESEEIEMNVGSFKAETNAAENLVIFDSVSDQRDPPTSTMSVPKPSSYEKDPQPIAKNAGKLNEILGEMELMKQRNEEMECELKEMQERYSEISLKFAEVEGERQQLVMKLRYLKNSKKNTVSALAVA